MMLPVDKSKLDHYYAVIMAGGGGTRLWPLSRQSKPKQMLSLFDERTLFQTSVQRLEGIFLLDHIYVVTVPSQAEELHAQYPSIPWENFLLEPAPRGTASVVGLAAVALQHRDPQAVMAVLTADHFIGNVDKFVDLLQTMYDVALQGNLVTLGIEPTTPATGFGYIQSGTHLGVFRGQKVYKVLRFKEKPDEVQARDFVASGDHYWNSGMFGWRVNRIMKEFGRLMPELSAGLKKIGNSWGTPEKDMVVSEVWAAIETQTIDYGIMEKAQDVVVIPASDLHWSDVGSWDLLFDVIEGDHDGNIVMGGEHVGLDTHRSLVYVNKEHRLIVTIGVEDLVLVDTGDVLLVCRKDQAQRVRQIVSRLIDEGREYY